MAITDDNLKVREFAAACGRPEATIRTWVYLKKIISFKLMGQRLIPASELKRLLRA